MFRNAPCTAVAYSNCVTRGQIFLDLPFLCFDPHGWEMPGPNWDRRIRGCGRPVQGVSSYEGNESHLKNQKKMVVKINFAAILWYIARVAS